MVLLSSVMQHVAPGTYTSSAVPLADAAYKDSKLAMSVLAEECETRKEAAAAATGVLLPVRFMSVNPGAVNSDIWRDDGWMLRMIYGLIFLTTPQGSETSVHAATAVQFASPPEGLRALYLVPYVTYWPIMEALGPFAGSVPGTPSRFVKQTEHRASLYALSMKLTGATDVLGNLLSASHGQ